MPDAACSPWSSNKAYWKDDQSVRSASSDLLESKCLCHRYLFCPQNLASTVKLSSSPSTTR
eukprot:scaffold1787_cov165-Cylindrotheca_fusiformis.AAC.4